MKNNFDTYLEGYGRHCNPEERNETPHFNVTVVTNGINIKFCNHLQKYVTSYMT